MIVKKTAAAGAAHGLFHSHTRPKLKPESGSTLLSSSPIAPPTASEAWGVGQGIVQCSRFISGFHRQSSLGERLL